MTHSKLIARLEALEGPCRKTDAMIGAWEHGHGAHIPPRKHNIPDGFFYVVEDGSFSKLAKEYTASLEATIALCEKMLPELEWEVGQMQTKIEGYFALFSSRNTGYSNSDISRHKQAAIALLIAMFKAKAMENEL